MNRHSILLKMELQNLKVMIYYLMERITNSRKGVSSQLLKHCSIKENKNDWENSKISRILCYMLFIIGNFRSDNLIWFNEIIGIKLVLTGLITGFFLSLIRLCLW